MSLKKGNQSSDGLLFTLSTGSLSPKTFVVTNFTLTESLSNPFQLDVGLASANPAIDFS
ncbi:hypothetical protein BDE27_2735 [Xenorhabdus ehlersii]|uniref:Rhs element Vgr family protein n=1 Tax=Xenorhabdus ehlersii TaxID=290111 RepID=A0A2D0IMU8_9GAMM|nr:Rhs element Vgr family protein [Xenorhabdus sp. TS4]PHM23137.1 Rhs element Vgr family protein [Xenorhabdus ehlersii]RKE89128.1 hypothetical protein BDE27_2735 [Xenorhabdus ehlersii]